MTAFVAISLSPLHFHPRLYFHLFHVRVSAMEEGSQPESSPIMFFLFLALFVSFISFLLVSLWKTNKKHHSEPKIKGGFSLLKCSLSGKTTHNHNSALVVEILTSSGFPKHQTPPSPSKWGAMVSAAPPPPIEEKNQSNGLELVFKVTRSRESDAGGDDCDKTEDLKGKKKKKRTKKKKQNSRSPDHDDTGFEIPARITAMAQEADSVTAADDKLGCTCRIFRGDLHGVDCPYPFTSSSSVIQRKIKQQYDQLVKSNDAKALTLAQVGQFANCLIDAKTTLQHKSEIIQRRFTITKSLLFKADKSSFDRLCGQIYKLETEQKRLEEDAIVYNRLQEQLKMSPAYQKMLEIGTHMELQASSGELLENPDAEFTDISFEELLAQEKKDSFWQRNGKLRSCAS